MPTPKKPEKKPESESKLKVPVSAIATLIVTVPLMLTVLLSIWKQPESEPQPSPEVAEKLDEMERTAVKTPSDTSSLVSLFSEGQPSLTLTAVDGRYVEMLAEDTARIWIADEITGAVYPYETDSFCVAWDSEGDSATVERPMESKTKTDYGRMYVIHLPKDSKGSLGLPDTPKDK